MRIEGVVFKSGEIPKRLLKVVSGTVREIRRKAYHDLGPGDYVALMEFLLSEPLEDDVVAVEESELVEVSLEEEYSSIVLKIVELRNIVTQSSVDLDKITLDDFNFEEVDLDSYLQQVEALLTLSAGELPEDRNEAIKVIESLEDDKLITKVNLVRKFVEKFPEDEVGARLMLETAAKVYVVLNDKYVAKAFLKKVLLRYTDRLDYCYEAIKSLEGIYKDEGNIIWKRYEKTARVIGAKIRGDA